MNDNLSLGRRPGLHLLLVVLMLYSNISVGFAQQGNFTRDHAEVVLETLKNDIKKNYYDTEFHGIDLEARFKAAKEKAKTATSTGQLMGIIAQTLLDFNDSHLYFIPPGRANRTDYGWEMQAIGEGVYVTAIKPGSDAEAKGLKEGDKIISVGGFVPRRDELWKLEYLFKGLRPQPGLHLVVQSPDGNQRELDAMAKIKQGKQIMDLTNSIDFADLDRRAEDEDRLDRSRYVEIGEEVMIWKLPTFAVDEAAIEAMMSRAKKFKSLILDLRGNGGGYVVTCQRLVSGFFSKELKIAEHKGRKEIKPMKSRDNNNPFTGKLIVLIDNRSASAAEIFARVIQLEKRGTVIGDRSAGMVMRARVFPHELGLDTIIPYAASVTDADVIMADGKSLEKVGVTPDEVKLPTAADLAAKRDPVLTYAAALAGVKIEPEKTGAFFPIEWRK
jgi:carboxyl-terminal processing protease